MTEDVSGDGLRIVEKYEGFVNYLYPIMQRCPRQHGVVRDIVLAALFEPIGELHHAARAQSLSRLYAIDAHFASLRAYLRFLAQGSVKIITPKNHQVALAHLGEVGAMLGAWQRKLKGRTGK